MVVSEPDSKKYKRNPTNNQWSNLAPDLLSLIITKLHFADRIRFRSVCKDWHNIPIGDRPINELPWVMTHADLYFKHSEFVSVKKSTVMLSDPLQKKTHLISTFPVIVDKCLNYFGSLTICASKCGWVLLANYKNLFVYSPFKNKVVMLPNLSSLFPFPFSDKATFSSTNPTSPNCIFVAIRRLDRCKLGISSYRYGDNDWRTKIFEGDFEYEVASFVCTEKGVCYFVLEHGKLGSFCVENQEFTWLANSVSILRGEMHLFELNGDLFLLVKSISVFYNLWEVFRYDENDRGWTEQEILGDISLFFCSCNSYLRPVIGDTSDLGDTTLYPYNCKNKSGIRVYSLKDGMWYDKSRVYDWMVKDSLEKVLIEPPY